MLQGWITFLNNFLATPSPLKAVLFGLLFSWAVTQRFKFFPKIAGMDEGLYKAVVRVVAFNLAYWPVCLMWPGELHERMLAAITTALFAPMAYKVVVTILYHFFPWMEPKLSAQPRDGGA